MRLQKPLLSSLSSSSFLHSSLSLFLLLRVLTAKETSVHILVAGRVLPNFSNLKWVAEEEAVTKLWYTHKGKKTAVGGLTQFFFGQEAPPLPPEDGGAVCCCCHHPFFCCCCCCCFCPRLDGCCTCWCVSVSV